MTAKAVSEHHSLLWIDPIVVHPRRDFVAHHKSVCGRHFIICGVEFLSDVRCVEWIGCPCPIHSNYASVRKRAYHAFG